jgi:hypothetical protein
MKKIELFGLMLFMFLKCHALNSDILYKPIVVIYNFYDGNIKEFSINPPALGFEDKEYFTAEECKKMIKISTDMEAERIKEEWEYWNGGNRFTDNAIFSDNLMIGFCVPKDERTIKFYPKRENITIANFKDYPAFTDEEIKMHKDIKYKEAMYRFISIPWVNYTPIEYTDNQVAQIGLIMKSYYTKKECAEAIKAYIKFMKYAEEDLKNKVSFEKISDTVYKVAGHMSSKHCYPVDESKLTYDPIAELGLENRFRIWEYPIFLDDPRPVYKTSFNCNPKKWTVTEKLICTDEVLADLDIELNTAYKEALKNAGTLKEKQGIQEAQREWVEEQSATLNMVKLNVLYKKRIKELLGE